MACRTGISSNCSIGTTTVSVSLRVGIWDGLVFVNLDPQAEPLEKVFAGVSETITPIRLADMKFHTRVV